MKKLLLCVIFGLLLATLVLPAGAEDLDAVVHQLENPRERREAIQLLEKKGKAAGKHLRKLATDGKKSRDGRVAAIMLIGKLHDEESLPDLEEMLGNDADRFCREASALSLGRMGSKRAIDKLQKALRDDSVNVRMRAAWALGKLGDQSGKAAALEAIKGNDVTGQFLAIDALEAISDKSAIPSLKENLNSANVWTKIYSKLAIARLEIQDLTEQERLEYLKKALNDDHYEVRRWAAEQLAMDGNEQSLNVLKTAATDKTKKSSYVAQKILDAMARKGNN